MKDVRLFFRIFYYSLILPVWLHTKKLPDLCRLLTPASINKDYPQEKVIRYSRLLTCLRIPTFGNYCLWRSLIFYKFLNEAGVKLTINVGVRIDERGRLRGHSWLTRDGYPYLSDALVGERFQLIYVFPESES